MENEINKKTNILISGTYFFLFHFPFSIFSQTENISYKTKKKITTENIKQKRKTS